MKKGKTIQELATEIQRQFENKRDFLIPANKINVFSIDDHVELGFAIKDNDDELFTAPLTDNGHIQMGQFTGIPKKYYDLILPHPALLATNLKHWLQRSQHQRMIRALDGSVRAVLSDKYRRLDNYDLAQSILPMLNEVDAQIESCEITDKRLYIKAYTHKVEGEVKVGDIVNAGIVVQNSETGHGSLSVKPLVFRKVCSNGLIVDKFAMRKYHAGRQQEMEQIEFGKDTIIAEDRAFWLKVRDLVKFSLSEVTFNKILETLQESAQVVIRNPEKALELATEKYVLDKFEKENVLAHLIQGGDLTSWGLGNAITRTAQDVQSYDRSTELEELGYEAMMSSWN